MATRSRLLKMFALSALLIAPAGVAQAQDATIRGTLVNLSPAGVVVDDPSGRKAFPLRTGAEISIRGEVELSELTKGAKIELHGRVEEGSKDVTAWGVTFYPLSRPTAAVSTHWGASPDRKEYFELHLFCQIVSTGPLKVLVLPGNLYDATIYDPASKLNFATEYRGPRFDGATLTLADANQGRRVTDVEFGANPQFAGDGATATVIASGSPMLADRVTIRRVQPFDMKMMQATSKKRPTVTPRATPTATKK